MSFDIKSMPTTCRPD